MWFCAILSRIFNRKCMISSRRAQCLVSGILMVLAPVAAMSGEIHLAWDGVADPRVAGYEVHFGAKHRTYIHHISTTSPSAMIGGLPGGTYFFAVRACTSDGIICSAFSDEVCALISRTSNSYGQPCELALPIRSGWRATLSR
jgi:hypothetical protein